MDSRRRCRDEHEYRGVVKGLGGIEMEVQEGCEILMIDAENVIKLNL